MKTNHTKGPWFSVRADMKHRNSGQRFEITIPNFVLCDVLIHKSDEETEANALLISKAPQMLEALQKVQERVMMFAAERDPDQLGTWGAIFNDTRKLLNELNQ
jgi:hypothetical protein